MVAVRRRLYSELRKDQHLIGWPKGNRKRRPRANVHTSDYGRGWRINNVAPTLHCWVMFTIETI